MPLRSRANQTKGKLGLPRAPTSQSLAVNTTITDTMIVRMLDLTVCEVWNQMKFKVALMMSIIIKIATSIRANPDPLRRTPTAILTVCFKECRPPISLREIEMILICSQFTSPDRRGRHQQRPTAWAATAASQATPTHLRPPCRKHLTVTEESVDLVLDSSFSRLRVGFV
jgi:hypothetical protein